uniref:DNA-directed DNA polymerase n=1 Tax=Lactarius deliciosus TaxID=55514 RepID=A0A2Z4MA08_9AGAM|nr:hypothetical protein [Lactarius deliciosus]AWX52995.1 hypothetical protein [Lactarius deliciosus]
MIFSEEMDNAVKLGYKFEILWGYTFKSKNIFKDFVENLYNLRLQYPKSNPLNYIAKIILNSVYGKFGMIDSFPDITIFNDIILFQEFEKDHAEDITDIIDLDGKILVKHREIKKDINTLLDSAIETHNVNVAIASAITAYARIHMSQFKNNPQFNLFYSDTDSIYIDKPLENNLVSNTELGLMKLENIIEKAIFLSPKVYILYGKDEYLNFMLDCDSKNISVNQSIPSAIAITAYARMYMFKTIYKLIELGIEVFYMDTDSLVVNQVIPEELIGNNLGLFKLEHDVAQGFFISPKLYALRTTNGELIIKAKGIGSKLEFAQFETLIKNESIVKAQERWFKDPANANINIKNIDMHISTVNLKRRQIMENNRLSFTKPLIIDNDEIL